MTSPYSETYRDARRRFLDVAAERSARVVSAVHPTERGALGEELAVDIATFGDPAAPRTLLLVSGTHGQEGFLGSALQLEFLASRTVPDGANVVALHALNPWGFSHLSRSDEANIDLNRNFLDHAHPDTADALYAEIFPALCPDDWTEETVEWSTALDRFVATHGRERLVTALAGGQSVEPTGLIFTGHRPAWSRTVVERLLPEVLAHTRHLAFIDWHTGLGAYGELSSLCSMEPGSLGHRRAREWMSDADRSPFAAGADLSQGETPSYRGLLSGWIPSAAPQAESAGLLIEVGTYENSVVQDAVRMDRWLRFGQGRTTTPREEMRRAMLEALHPADPAWREAALKNGLDAQTRALESLLTW